MKLTFKRREVTSVEHLGTLVADNIDAIEPGLQILASNLNLGRTKVELAGLDGEHVPVLFILGLAADDAMLVRALEAYAWCLEYPESVQRLVPANVQLGWPPRIVFVAERLLEAFVRKLRLLNFSAVDCFEFRYVEANGPARFSLAPGDCGPWGLRPRSDAPPGRRSREVPALLRPPEQSPASPREISRPPPPAAPAAARAPQVEPRTKSDGARADVPKNGSKSDLARNDTAKGDLAPTWRKFLDRLTSTFDARTGPAPEPPRAVAPPPPSAESTPRLAIQPFAADIQVSA